MTEILICDNCWEARNEIVWEHACLPKAHASCDCPCVERHNDLDTIDLQHDQGMRDITSPFTGEWV